MGGIVISLFIMIITSPMLCNSWIFDWNSLTAFGCILITITVFVIVIMISGWVLLVETNEERDVRLSMCKNRWVWECFE